MVDDKSSSGSSSSSESDNDTKIRNSSIKNLKELVAGAGGESSHESIFMSVGIFVLVAVTIAGYLGYKGREQVVGIDLGTTFSVVAYKSHAGDVTVIPDWMTGKPLTPSVVHYQADGEPLVGAQAIPYRETNPEDTIYNAKRFIGKKYSEVGEEIKTHRYKVTDPGEEKDSEFQLALAQKNVNGIEVGADVLKYLHKSIKKFRGYPMQTAVICIPAKFGAAEASATKVAFENAGFKVLRVMDEPTAAAVAYNLHKSQSPRNILVYDFGGGTLDASLLWMNGDAATMLGTHGDDHLGGSDFDHVVQDHLSKKLVKCEAAALGVLAEQAKIELSSKETTKVVCKEESADFTKKEFESIADHLFKKSLLPIAAILEEAMMEPHHVSDVVLVGGATRMPKVRQQLRDYFPEGTAVHTHIDPDTTIAVGAANIY